ncbi:prostaglandin E2 receptor EP1 subtype-like [Scomber scombrus]|uniref:prostaglandin E2 receptor EP1 subtype-like n=1 Tax=Scomber scombrus TaxID=13677 RepID=UPI002DD9DA31|nr:prostaglandin E2 receptor EP1 subtype-like [Scomber scombrus]
MLAMQHYNTSGIIASFPLSNQTTMVQESGVNAVSHDATNQSNPTGAGAGISMTLGILFNVVALFILAKAYNRFRRRSKATFLLFASSLVATDLAGHVIPGALVLSRYSDGIADPDPSNPDASCLFLGSCMVFFGLCPLFLGCGMAAERCLGVTKPLLHARLVTTARTKIALALIWLLALCVALLPFFGLGAYTHQYPRTWCFIRVMEKTQATDLAFVILFSGLALSSLASAFVCNTISGITLVRARLKKKSSSRRSSARSHDTEMVVQLVGIMVTSCICWSPLLIFGLMSATRSYRETLGDDMDTYKSLMVTGVRMATCNQILDPWVYILLRRAILRKIYRITKRQASFKTSKFYSVRWDVNSFQSSEKNSVKKI